MSMFAIAIASLTLAPPTDLDPSDVFGRWMTHDGDSIILIEDCGDGTPCGHIEWSRSDPHGTKIDTANEVHGLQSRPLKGAVMLEDFKPSSKGWKKGKLYNPESGKSYRGALRRRDQQSITVQGCIGPICKGFIWEAASPPPASE